MAWVADYTFTTGEVVTASLLNGQVRDRVSFLANPPACRVYNSSNISISNATDTALTFDSERFDTASIHSTTTNTGRLTCPTAGLYHVFAGVDWAFDADGVRNLQIRLNGSTVIAETKEAGFSTATEKGQNLATVYKLAVSDYVEVIVNQNAGNALNVLATGNHSPEFGMQWVGFG